MQRIIDDFQNVYMFSIYIYAYIVRQDYYIYIYIIIRYIIMVAVLDVGIK